MITLPSYLQPLQAQRGQPTKVRSSGPRRGETEEQYQLGRQVDALRKQYLAAPKGSQERIELQKQRADTIAQLVALSKPSSDMQYYETRLDNELSRSLIGTTLAEENGARTGTVKYLIQGGAEGNASKLSVGPKAVLDSGYVVDLRTQPLYRYQPPKKKRGGVGGLVSNVASGLLNVGGDLLKPLGLEKYAAPIIGAGITAASGGTLGAAIAGGAFAGGAQPIAAGNFSGGLKGAALGGLAGGLGGLASTVNPVTSLGGAGNLVANQAIQGGLSGAAEGLLTGQNPIKSGLLGAALSGGTAGVSAGLQAVGNALGDAGKTTQVVGGIDDSRFDLGKSAPSLMTPPTGVFNQNSASTLAEQIAKMSGTDLSGTAFGSMDSRFTDPVSGGTAVQGGGLTTGSTNGLGATSGFISAPSIGFTSSTKDFNPLNYDRMISGISGTDLTGSNFGGGITQNTPGALGEGVTQLSPLPGKPVTTKTSDELAQQIVNQATKDSTADKGLGGLGAVAGLLGGAGLLSLLNQQQAAPAPQQTIGTLDIGRIGQVYTPTQNLDYNLPMNTTPYAGLAAAPLTQLATPDYFRG